MLQYIVPIESGIPTDDMIRHLSTKKHRPGLPDIENIAIVALLCVYICMFLLVPTEKEGCNRFATDCCTCECVLSLYLVPKPSRVFFPWRRFRSNERCLASCSFFILSPIFLPLPSSRLGFPCNTAFFQHTYFLFPDMCDPFFFHPQRISPSPSPIQNPLGFPCNAALFVLPTQQLL